jgi:hypothetical protein
MTVYQTIVEWLNQILLELKTEFPHPYTIIEPEKIPLQEDYPGVPFQAGGIFSSPNDISTTLMGGQVKHTEFKFFYLRRPFNECDSRVENEGFFERLREIIHEKNLDCAMPVDGRQWKEINVNSGIYPAQRDEGNRWADYLVPLQLIYIS